MFPERKNYFCKMFSERKIFLNLSFANTSLFMPIHSEIYAKNIRFRNVSRIFNLLFRIYIIPSNHFTHKRNTSTTTHLRTKYGPNTE